MYKTCAHIRPIPAVAYSTCMHYSSHSHALNDKIVYFSFVLFIFVFMISYMRMWTIIRIRWLKCWSLFYL